MEHPGEIWQEFDINGERLGGIDPNNYDMDKVKRFGGVAVMLYRVRNGEVEFLFQHRSKSLMDSPDKWDVSAGGHINLDEPLLDSLVRETREEIGVSIEKEKAEFAASYLVWKVKIHLFFYDWNDRDDEFSFDDEEVQEVKWIKYSELNEFLPKLKWQYDKDKVFLACMEEWHNRILEKYPQ
jgi:8-oxo-dGTP pyrophosphatase MutT (NUDIX family)